MKPIRNTAAKPPRIILYGVRGIGKTTFASHANAPIFVRTEDGLADIETDTFPLCQSYSEVLEQLAWLATEQHQFRTVALDSMSALEALVWQDVLDKYRDQRAGRLTSIEQYAYKAGYLYAADELGKLMQAIDRLRERGMASILIAHSRELKVEPPDAEPFTKYGPALHKEAAGRLMDWADAVLFASRAVSVAKPAGRSRGRALALGERVLHTEDAPSHCAKNRFRLPAELPFEFGAFRAAFAAAAKTQQQQHKTEEPVQ